MATEKIVYMFGDLDDLYAKVKPSCWDDVRSLLGGKGANLAEMTRVNIPVPPGFTITTDACKSYMQCGRKLSQSSWDQIDEAIRTLEKQTGKTFGDAANPLLVSCRSGAKFSMPGMMDTILNIGLNDETTSRMVEGGDDARFVYDCYRRLIQMFGSVVLNIVDEEFDLVIEQQKAKHMLKVDSELSAEHWKHVIERFKAIIKTHTRREFPQDPLEQLRASVIAVFRSWFGKRAYDYRNATKISHDLGTAANVQSIVFGNADENSGTGVVFTRNPATGENELYGDYLMVAQGEDVVAGIRNTSPIAKLRIEMPQVYAEFEEVCQKLENHFNDMQDIEFTIEKGKLWILQTRDGKRTARAAVKIAVDLVHEGMIDKATALHRVTSDQIDMLLHRQFDASALEQAKAKGNLLTKKSVNASPGAAVGMAVFDANTAVKWALHGDDVILVRSETKPEDVHGMIESKGILTSRGGATSHAAVVARQFGIPAVCGAEELKIDTTRGYFSVKEKDAEIQVKAGDWISIDGTTGQVFLGKLETTDPDFGKEETLHKFLSWADDSRTLEVWANADTGDDAIRARRFGAQGIGLCRTEHMFFEPERVPIVQEMIMAEGAAQRASALERLLPMQQSDFEEIFRAMNGYPVVIRLLDPPLHEFLPAHDDLVDGLADLKVKLMRCNTLSEIDKLLNAVRKKQRILSRVESLREANPMLGLRGDRLGIMMPDVSEMQVKAIFRAAAKVQREGRIVKAKIMIPLAGHVNELKVMRELVDRVAATAFEELRTTIEFDYGTMVEVPRAALTADEMAREAEFFSFGTNDLTQTTFGMSRDDAEAKFLSHYVKEGILHSNPFQTLDVHGVGQLIEMAVRLGRRTRPDLQVGICGEHGGDPQSIAFCHRTGLDYVSCGAFRVPGARLAAAQAALSHKTLENHKL